tara:strand:- start:4813 stop:6945 length:2133 start_codon:yes stop_codon:yes gene_type:complete
MLKQNKKPAILAGEGLPNYKEITPNEINEHLPNLLEEVNRKLIRLEESLDEKLIEKKLLRWDEVMKPLNQIGEKLRWSWGVISHLNGVCNSTELRNSYTKQQPEIVRFGNKIGQSKIIYKALLDIKERNSNTLNEIQLRIIKSELLSMNLRGVGLNKEAKATFNKNSERLAELSNLFSNHVLDSTKEWSLLLTKKTEVEGLPQRVLETLANSAKESGDKHSATDKDPTMESGPWRLGLDMPRYIPFITYSKNRYLREVIYKAHVSRASDGPLDNQEIIQEILELRNEQANLLGYENWAQVSLSNKMAKDINKVEGLLEELRSAAMPVAKKELIELEECAKRHNAPEASQLAPWDISFWSEKLRQEKFDLNQELLRPWFPLSQVLKGLFELCGKLFDIKIIRINNQKIPVWHQDVSFFHVLDQNDNLLAGFYLDPYSRSSTKRGGAWMDECLTRDKREDGKKVIPIAYLVCNQTPPMGNTPSLMSFEEVETLFHEFGHGLQHMLTTVDYPQAAGINNVEWDAVELPSQFMENWCLDRSTIMNIARHWETKEALPEEEFQKLRLSRTFNSGMATLRQLHFAITDLRLHSQWNKAMNKTPDQLRREIAETTTVLSPIKEDHFLCAFSHIFAGGYAAGYYSYKWAEVLSSDAFSAFEEAGLENNYQVKSIGKKFRETILSLGGSKPPSEIFKAFRGRDPSTKALIRHLGLISSH